MKCLGITWIVFLVAFCAAPVEAQYGPAQYGPYGSPDMVPPPQVSSAAAPNGHYPPSGNFQHAPQYAPPAHYPPASAYPPAQPDPIRTALLPPWQNQPNSWAASQPAPQGRIATTYTDTGLPAEPMSAVPPASAASRPNAGFVSQMIDDQAVADQPAAAQSSTPYYEGAGDDCGCGEAGCGYLCGPRCSPWYGSLAVLCLGRNSANRTFTTYSTNDVSDNELLPLEMSWRWGGEVRIGRRFCRGCKGTGAIEGVYWTTDSGEELVALSMAPPDSLSTPLNVSFIEMLDPWATPPDSAYADGTNWFDAAAAHRLQRYNEFHNVELNMLLGRGYDPSVSPWSVNWLTGVRFFRFHDGLTFGSVAWGYGWGLGGGVYEAYIDEQVTNNLVGFQFGFNADYHLTPKCRFFASPRFSVCGNQIDNHYHIYRGDGSPARPTAASNQTGTFPVDSSETAMSFLMQTEVGVQWNFTANWSARIGYRVMAATGIALADHQIPFYTVDIPAVADVDNNGELVLHGGFIGIGYNF